MVIGAHIVAGLVLVPVRFLMTVTAMAFGPWLGIIYWLFGCLGSAMLTSAIGRLLGHDIVRSIGGSRIDRLSRRVARHGLLGVLTVRVLPVAPFTIVNIVAGASHIRVRDFALDTLLGMLPGILLMTLFGGQLKDTILDPRLENLVVLMVLIALIVVGTIWASRRFADGDASKTATASTERAELLVPGLRQARRLRRRRCASQRRLPSRTRPLRLPRPDAGGCHGQA